MASSLPVTRAPSTPVRKIVWMPWRGRNAELQREREAAPRKVFAFSPRDPAGYVQALPRAPLFYSQAAADRAEREKRAASGLSTGWSLAPCVATSNLRRAA
jgi:hypothetical protein